MIQYQTEEVLLGGGAKTQRTLASPSYPSGQVQIGTWFWTEHLAISPQAPIQGFLHLWFIQAAEWKQSELSTHSGLQFGGRPIKFNRQEHAGWEPITLHWELDPQGLGEHGFPRCLNGGCVALDLVHWTSGSPVYPFVQVQMGLWFTVKHLVFNPQEPGQGSAHLFSMQALFWGHSELTIHSGRHVGGTPTNPGWQRQTACPLCTRQLLFGPQGDGSQGLSGNGSGVTSISVQALKGSPVKPGKQVQEGAWLITRHVAPCPQVPGQGFTHLLFKQALLRSQSVFVTHSGLHPMYGSPMYSGRQVQDPTPFLSLQIAFAPHGDGLHGVRGCSVVVGSENLKIENVLIYKINFNYETII